MGKRLRGLGGGQNGFLLVAVVATMLILTIALYATMQSLQITSANVVKKEEVVLAQMGAESAIEAAIRKLNESATLQDFGTNLNPGGAANDCDALAGTQPQQNAPPLTYGQYIVTREISGSTNVVSESYMVNWAVNMDLSASALADSDAWQSASVLLTNNEGFPDPGGTPWEYNTSATGMSYEGKCLDRTTERLLRAEASVVYVDNPVKQLVRRRVAARVTIDPGCTTPAGCRVEVTGWRED